MSLRSLLVALLLPVALGVLPLEGRRQKETLYLGPLGVAPKPVAQDKDVKVDYPLVYVRVPPGAK